METRKGGRFPFCFYFPCIVVLIARVGVLFFNAFYCNLSEMSPYVISTQYTYIIYSVNLLMH